MMSLRICHDAMCTLDLMYVCILYIHMQFLPDLG